MPSERLDKQQQRRRAMERFRNAERIEREYMRTLRYLTRQIDQIVKVMVPVEGVQDTTELQKVLRQYSATIRPWAQAAASKIVTRVAKKDEQSWAQLGRSIGKEIKKELDEAPTGAVLRGYLAEQVNLITSLPLEAAERVHTLTLEGLAEGRRADSIAKDIRETGDVTESRARLIARTEVARTASGLTRARATHIGSTHYIWRTSKDGTVRESHKKMDGQVIAWNNPPEVEPGKRYHAGEFCNCRCWPEPIFNQE